MVPTSLTLENFLSYRKRQTLDFDQLSLACLSGENGHGKSALLDAMTWALWGEARKPSSQGKPDDTLLNESAKRSEGATEMEVKLEFEVEGNPYRVVRSYRKTASGKTTSGDLKFYTSGSELTAKTMRKTQSVINETVGTEYDTFINTSFLLQGRSDELTQKRPAERKKVLSNVLRLGRFDELGDACLKERRDVENKIGHLESEIDVLGRKLEGAEKRKDELEETKERLAGHRSHKGELEKKRSEIRDQISEAESAREESQELGREIADVDQQISQIEDTISGLDRKIENGQEVEEKAEEIREKYDTYQDLQQELTELQSQQDEHLNRKENVQSARENYTEAKNAASSLRQSAERQLENIKSDLRDLHSGPLEKDDWDGLADAAISSLEENFQEAKARRDAIDVAKEKRENQQEELSEITAEISDLKSEVSVLESDLESRRQDIQELNDIDGNRCPRCGSEVSEDHISSEINEAQSDISDLRDSIEDIEEEIEDLRSEKSRLESSIDDLEEHLEELRGKPHPDPIEDDLTRARRLQSKAESAWQTVSSSEEELMREEDYDPDALKSKLSAAQERLEKLDFDQDRLHTVRDKVEDLSGIAEKKNKLERALDKLERWRERRSEKQEELNEKQSRAEDLRQKKSHLESQAEGLSELKQKQRELNQSLDEVEEDISAAQQRIGRLQSQIEDDKEAREEIADLEDELGELKEREHLLEHLREAFSKHGIPSLIIENAIPDLEERANRLLGRLTDGMSLRLETTRETQSGDTTDTLQILIDDESGATRPYESFSGGEGFRVDFALRVALSQLLARRSGAPLRTLVIDEGFGTQDANGLRAVKEAISEVASDFELVLVITHLEELKDAFPQRVEVEKTPGRGSTFTIHQ